MFDGCAMARLPESVKVLGTPYTVKVVSKRTIRKRAPGGIDAHGICDAYAKILYISRDDKPAEQWTTLLHEIIHAVLKEAWLTEAVGLDLRDYEEPLVLMLEKGLYPALRETGWGPEE